AAAGELCAFEDRDFVACGCVIGGIDVSDHTTWERGTLRECPVTCPKCKELLRAAAGGAAGIRGRGRARTAAPGPDRRRKCACRRSITGAVALGKGIVRGEENRPGVVVSPRPTPGVSRKGRSTLAHAEGLGKELFAVNKTAGAAVSAV